MQNHQLMTLARQLLGQEVSYVQVTADNSVFDRRGVITSLHLGADRRLQVRLADAGGQINADLAACELDEAQRQDYLDHVMRIRAQTDAIKKAQADLITAGNNDLEKIYDLACGLPAEFTVPPYSGPNKTVVKAESLDEKANRAS